MIDQPFVFGRLRRDVVEEYPPPLLGVPIEHIVGDLAVDDRSQRFVQCEDVEQSGSESEAAGWIGDVCRVTGQQHAPHTEALGRSLMHAVRRMHLQPALARPGQNGLEVPRHALEHGLLRERSILAVRTAP